MPATPRVRAGLAFGEGGAPRAIYDFVVAGGASPGADVDSPRRSSAEAGPGVCAVGEAVGFAGTLTASPTEDGFAAAAAAAAFFFASAAAAASAKFLSTAAASTG